MILDNSSWQNSQQNDPVSEEAPAPFAPPTHSKKITVAILAIVLVAAIAVMLSQKLGGPLPTWDEIYEAVGLAETSEAHENALVVHFIDVGQGDCIFVQTPTGDSLLIDGGERGNESTIVSYLEQYGDGTLEYVVATHPHSDHI